MLHEILTAEEELELIIRVQDNNDREALTRLVTCNQALIKNLLRKTVPPSTFRDLPYERKNDLLQEGTLGLIIAIRRHNRKTRLSTYARHWIRERAFAFLYGLPVVYVPKHIQDALGKLGGPVKALQTLKETSGSSKVPLGNGESINKWTLLRGVKASSTRTFDGEAHGEIGGSDLLMLEDEEHQAYLLARAKEFMGELSNLERTVLMEYFGLGKAYPGSLVKAAEAIGFSREYARLIRNTALEKLRRKFQLLQARAL